MVVPMGTMSPMVRTTTGLHLADNQKKGAEAESVSDMHRYPCRDFFSNEKKIIVIKNNYHLY